ncbi:MAG: hypothetical protein ACMUIU_06155 [bacterium]
MQEAVAIVENLTDVQAISLLKKLYRDLFKTVPYQEMLKSLADGVEEVDYLQNLDVNMKKQNLSPEKSVEATKHVLLTFAQNEDFAPLLVQIWEEIKNDDSLFIEVIITVGLIVNLTLFMASEIELNVGGLTIKKGKVSNEKLKTIMEPVTELIKRIPTGF